MKVFKKLSMCILSGLLCLGIAAASPAPAQAAEKIGNGVYYLDTSDAWNTMQDSYTADITGDGKADTIRTICSKSSTRLVVNGKNIKSWSSKNALEIRVVTLSGKKSFLDISSYCRGGKNTCGLYQVKKNKLSKVLDYTSLVNLKQLTSNSFVFTDKLNNILYAQKVRGNTIYLNARFGTKNLGQVDVDNLALSWNGKKFTLKTTAVSARAQLIGTWEKPYSSYTASKKIQTYKAAGSSKKSIAISKNTAFTIQKLAVVKKNFYILAKTKAGKTGWIKLDTSNNAIVKLRSSTLMA